MSTINVYKNCQFLILVYFVVLAAVMQIFNIRVTEKLSNLILDHRVLRKLRPSITHPIEKYLSKNPKTYLMGILRYADMPGSNQSPSKYTILVME